MMDKLWKDYYYSMDKWKKGDRTWREYIQCGDFLAVASTLLMLGTIIAIILGMIFIDGDWKH